ncbi:MAG: hypothetical protein MRY79_02495 [Alphaproteobacteria bacterium]|nr:hypothetical protein [Alphaproteobacteria bacterium]
MTRWSLSNFFRPVSHEQFVSYAQEFKKAAEQEFGMDCKVEINLVGKSGFFASKKPSMIQSIKNISDVTPNVWKNSAYVELNLRPSDIANAPEYAWAHAEFKGARPRQATFYVQPGGKRTRDLMTLNAGRRITGDGFASNDPRESYHWRLHRERALQNDMI